MSMIAYSEYKDSGVPWLGTVPAEWETAALKRLVRLQSGEGITSADIQPEGSYPVFGGNGHRGFTEHFTHQGEFALIGRQGALCGNINYASGRFWASEHALVAHPVARFEVRWLGETLRAMNLGQYSVAAAQPGLSADLLGNLSVPVPPLPEQAAIAAFLDRETGKIDALVEEQRRLIALLKEKRQAVISHAVTKGLNPHAPLKPSGIEWLGDIPAHWEMVPLKHVAHVQTGVAKGKDYAGKPTVAVPYLRVANVQDGYIDIDEVAEIEIAEEEVERYSLQAGDVLMNEGGDFDKLGRGGVWQGQISPCIHQNHVFAVRPHRVSSEWLSAVTSSSYAQHFFMGRSKQSTNLASISSTNLMELPVVVPPADEQSASLEWLDEALRKLDGLSLQSETAVALLQERRAALISAAVTGKIDVRGLVDAAGEMAA